jgi:hypothetical protein
MNNTRADMFHDLVCEHRKLSDAHSKLELELTKKGNLLPTYPCMPDALPFPFFFFEPLAGTP